MLQPDEPALSARLPTNSIKARSPRDKPIKSPHLFSVGTKETRTTKHTKVQTHLELQSPDVLEPKHSDNMLREDSDDSSRRPKLDVDERGEKNEELMSLLACLNEQAINEINTQQDKDIETG